jgi:hypothetical protein
MTPRSVGERGVALIMFHQSCDLLYRCVPSPNIAAGEGNIRTHLQRRSPPLTFVCHC